MPLRQARGGQAPIGLQRLIIIFINLTFISFAGTGTARGRSGLLWTRLGACLLRLFRKGSKLRMCLGLLGFMGSDLLLGQIIEAGFNAKNFELFGVGPFSRNFTPKTLPYFSLVPFLSTSY